MPPADPEGAHQSASAVPEPAAYRSVLPHEPLPRDDGGPGVLHVQGSFVPKLRTANKAIQDKTLEYDDIPQPGSAFWTREALQEALSAYFIARSSAHGAPSVAASDIHFLDRSPPYTKVRLEYATVGDAFRALIDLRRREVAPRDVLAGLPFGSAALVFPGKPLQVALLTRQPLASPGWAHANPPRFRRLVTRSELEDAAALRQERESTRFVHIGNLLAPPPAAAATDDGHDGALRFFVAAAVRSVVDAYDSTGTGAEVFVAQTGQRKHAVAPICHVGMRTPADARALIDGLQGRRVVWRYPPGKVGDESECIWEQTSGTLFLDYAALSDRVRRNGEDPARGDATRPDCTSSTAHVVVPGLIIVPDFVTEAQEAAILAVVTGPHAPWAPAQTTSSENGTLKRRVQHYGYVFDYKTADVLRNRTDPGAGCPPMPAMLDLAGIADSSKEETTSAATNLDSYLTQCINAGEGWGVLAGVLEHVRRFDFGQGVADGVSRIYPSLNQLTINEYNPGQGIGSHVDTPSAFGEGLLSLSLGSGIVMEFRKVNAQEGEDRKKLVYLPRRSIVLMSGEARYEWNHMIVTRTTDVHNGELLTRERRVSLTFRTALNELGGPLPLVESNIFPPIWKDETTSASLQTPACERDHVHAVYDAIALQWHHTRGRRGALWSGATRFLDNLEPGSILADVGCGDGKYFPAVWNRGSYVIGTDISMPLLKTACMIEEDEATAIPDSRRVCSERRHLQHRPTVCAADCMSIPLRRKSCDAAICIAVLHHLSTVPRRRRCIEELVRIVKPGGLINIQAWAYEQENDSTRSFAARDVFVSFNAQPKYLQVADKSDAITKRTLRTGSDCETTSHKSIAQAYSEALNADYDDEKGLVVFQRYCHLYRKGELEKLIIDMPDVDLLESGFEKGNYFITIRVTK